MSGHLRRCRCAAGAHVFVRGVLQYAPTGSPLAPPCDPPSKMEMAEVPEGGISRVAAPPVWTLWADLHSRPWRGRVPERAPLSRLDQE